MRRGFRSRLLASIILCAVIINSTIGIQFQPTEPLQLMQTEYVAEKGITELYLSIKIENLCQTNDNQNWTSVYNIKKTAYDRIQNLCLSEYNIILDLIGELTSCLPKTRRVQRMVPLVIGGIVVGVVAGGKAIYRYTGYNSDYNRLNRIEERESYVNKTIEALIREQHEDRESHQQLVDLAEQTNERTQDNKNGILQLATLAAEISWTSSKLGIRLNSYREGLRMIKGRCGSRIFSMDGLSKIREIKELAYIRDENTWISDVYLTARDTINFQININTARPNSYVYEVVAMDHWANYTFAPVFVTYTGPKFVISDEARNCVRGIDKPRHRSVYEICMKDNYRDPGLSSWIPVGSSDEEIEKRSKPIVLKVGRENIIYCFYHNITIDGHNDFCPPSPFKMSQSQSFNLSEIDYQMDTQHMSKQTSALKIQTPILSNISDSTYSNTQAAFLNLKKANEGRGKLRYQDGAINIPIPTLGYSSLCVIASIITLWKVITRFIYRSTSDQQSSIEKDEHHESHSEQMQVNINLAPEPVSTARNNNAALKQPDTLELFSQFQDFQRLVQFQQAQVPPPLPDRPLLSLTERPTPRAIESIPYRKHQPQ